MTREALAEAISAATPLSPREPPPVSQYVQATARAFGVKPSEILGHRRFPRLVNARHVAMALVYADTLLSLPQIGDEFDRDHTTVAYALRRVAASPTLTAYAAAVRADMEGDTDD